MLALPVLAQETNLTVSWLPFPNATEYLLAWDTNNGSLNHTVGTTATSVEIPNSDAQYEFRLEVFGTNGAEIALVPAYWFPALLTNRLVSVFFHGESQPFYTESNPADNLFFQINWLTLAVETTPDFSEPWQPTVFMAPGYAPLTITLANQYSNYLP